MFRILLLSYDGIGQQQIKHHFLTVERSEEKSMTYAIMPDLIGIKRSNYDVYGESSVALLSTRSLQPIGRVGVSLPQSKACPYE